MSIIENILSEAKALSEQEFRFKETSDFNEASQLGEGLEGLVTKATVLHIRIKGLFMVTKSSGKRASATIYKLFELAVKHFADETKGIFTTYTSDSFLIVYPESIKAIGTHIDNAFKLSYVLKTLVAKTPTLKSCDFAIGVDHGKILVTRNTCGLQWYGTCIHKAEAIGELCFKPAYVGISGVIYSELDEDHTTTTRHILGIPKKENIWQKGSYQFEGEHKHFYSTRHNIEME